MKNFFVCMGLLLVAASLSAQPGPPKSPAATETGVIAGKTITISYASPRVNGRVGKIFTKDGLISHDPTYPAWRAGANAATKLHPVVRVGQIHIERVVALGHRQSPHFQIRICVQFGGRIGPRPPRRIRRVVAN